MNLYENQYYINIFRDIFRDVFFIFLINLSILTYTVVLVQALLYFEKEFGRMSLFCRTFSIVKCDEAELRSIQIAIERNDVIWP